MVRKSPQTSSHLVDAGFDSRPDICRKLEKRGVEAAVENLEGAHWALALTGSGVDALRLFLLRLFKGSFKLRREFEFVLQKIVERTPELRQLSLRKLMKLGFDLFDLAHCCRVTEAGLRDKEGRRRAMRGCAIRDPDAGNSRSLASDLWVRFPLVRFRISTSRFGISGLERPG